VTAVNGKQIENNAGSMGVKKGDEWLIANPAFFPQRDGQQK
jgi:hypothetical protein